MACQAEQQSKSAFCQRCGSRARSARSTNQRRILHRRTPRAQPWASEWMQCQSSGVPCFPPCYHPLEHFHFVTSEIQTCCSSPCQTLARNPLLLHNASLLLLRYLTMLMPIIHQDFEFILLFYCLKHLGHTRKNTKQTTHNVNYKVHFLKKSRI